MEKKPFYSTLLPTLLGSTIALGLSIETTHAGDIVKANNTSNLNGAGAWVGGVAPGTNDTAVWSNTVLSAANCTNGPGADLFWLGIKVLNPPAPASVNAGSPVKNITVGSGGINLADLNTTQDFTANGFLTASNSQTWRIKAGRTLTFNNNADVLDNTVLTLDGDGTLNSSGGANPVLRVGAGSFGTAIVNQSAGLNHASRSGSGAVQLNIGRFSGNAGIYNLTGGTIDADDNTSGIIRIGDAVGAQGAMNVSGGQVAAVNFDLGNQGTGSLTVSGSGVVVATGTINMPRASGATGFLNLDGGILTMGSATAAAGGNGTFNFNGGLLKANASTATFMQNLIAANVKEGGARIDCQTFDVTIAQALLHGGNATVDGGLTKQGTGTLTLTGANSYTGLTLVQQGKLVITTAHVGGGDVTVSDGASLEARVAAAGTTLALNSLTLGQSSGAVSTFNLSVFGNTTAPVILATNLVTHGSVEVDVSGVGLAIGQCPLVQYSGAIGGNGFAAFTLVGLPLDVVATLSNNVANSTIDLVISAAPSLLWTGSVSGDWDIATTANWLNASSQTVTYTDGYPVVFDDRGVGSVNVSTTVSPGGVTVSNNSVAYSFSGAGQISGSGPFKKLGAGALTLLASNSYGGDTVVSSGSLIIGANSAIPSGAGKGKLVVDSLLDLAGFNQSINGLNGSGTIDNNSGSAVTLTVGNNNSSGAFTGVIQNSVGSVSLNKTGTGTLLLTGNNTYSGGTTNSGMLQVGNDNALGTGLVRLNANAILTSDSTTPRTLANNFLINGATSWGDPLKATGAITVNGNIDFLAAVRNVTCNTDMSWTGQTSNGGVNKLGSATLTLRGTGNWTTATSVVRNGTLVLDGGSLATDQSFRVDCNIASGLARLVLTNGTSVNITAPDANIRSGYSANVGATNIFDIAGTIRTSAATNGQGAMIIGAGCALGIVNLWTGGDVEVWSINPADVNDLGASQLNLRGGTIHARTSNAAFMQGLTAVNIYEGVTIDSDGYNISVAQPVAGSGGIAKIGQGTLTLLGTNTFSGTSIAQEGVLMVSSAHAGGGAFSAADGATFGVKLGASGASLKAATVTLGAASGANCTFDLGVGNAIAPVLYATNFVTHGTVLINVVATGLTPGQFTLVQYQGTIGGNRFAAFALGALPQGVSATLINNTAAHSVDLRIDAVTPLVWMGDVSGDWDINGSANWRLGGNPSVYSEQVVPGPPVRFDDTATGSSSVNVTVPVSPASLTISNQTLGYAFSGGGKISGSTGLLKQGAAGLTLAVGCDYAGNTVVQQGKLTLGGSDVLPRGVGKGDVVLSGVLDLAGNQATINGLSGAGTVDNSSGITANLLVGSNGTAMVYNGTFTETGGPIALTKLGAGNLTLNGNNAHSAGTTVTGGTLLVGNDHALGSGLVALSGGNLASDSTAARTITNAFAITAATTLGDLTNSGALTMTGPIDLLNSARNVTLLSDVTWTGFCSDGRINKLGTGTLTVKGALDWNADAEVRNGVLVLDGAMATNSGSLRPDIEGGAASARLVITNGAVLVLTSATANARAGWDGDIVGTNYLDIAGTIRMPNAGSVDGRLNVGRNGTRAIVSLYSSADISVRSITPGGSAGYSEVNFNGGIVRAVADATDFMQGLNVANIRAGGVTIDSSSFAITIAQPLQGVGGLTKVGLGTLWLNGTNTYTGATLINEGILGGSGVVAGSVTIAATGTLAPGAPFGTFTVNNALTLAGTTQVEINKTAGVLTSDRVIASTLNCGGVLVVNNIGTDSLAQGDTFDLFDAGSVSGSFASITLPTLPDGLIWNTSRLLVDGTISVGTPSSSAQFSSYSINSSTVSFSGSGGLPGATYYLESCTSLAAPIQWSAVQTNTFDGSGNFSTSYPRNPATPTQFFRLHVP
jgi:fibronectin-binding autotransporter adhesin